MELLLLCNVIKTVECIATTHTSTWRPAMDYRPKSLDKEALFQLLYFLGCKPILASEAHVYMFIKRATHIVTWTTSVHFINFINEFLCILDLERHTKITRMHYSYIHS